MRIHVLGGYGGESDECRVTCLLINRHLALDAGSLSRALAVKEQEAVRSIVLTHSHMDHTSSLPFFIENVYGATDGPIQIYASAATISAVKKHLFNNATWPDFTRLPNDLLPAIAFNRLEDGVPVTIEGVRLTPIPVNHPVPTYAFLLQDDGAAVLWSSDTGPTERLWQVANAAERLDAVCLETSFDNSLQRIADLSGHLTPQTLKLELRKLERRAPILLHHLKPPCIDRIHGEVAALGHPDVEFLTQDRTYDFS